MIKHLRLILKIILIFVVAVLLINIFEPLRKTSLSEAQTEEILQKNYEEGSACTERIQCIDDNYDALLLRLSMIEQAEESIVFTTFDFREDESGGDIMAAFYQAAERGVHIQMIVDGLNELLYLEKSPFFQALCEHENVEACVYNPVNLKNIWHGNYRMHDKYLMIDDKMYLLGGRNTNDIFLGNSAESINIDRDIFVYETIPGKGESMEALKDYFSQIWQEPCVEKIRFHITEMEKNAAIQALEERYEKICLERNVTNNEINWIEATYPVNKISLLHNGTSARKKAPLMLTELENIMEKGKDVIIQTPYIICNEQMYQSLENINAHADVKIIINAVERGTNPWGCADYLNSKDTILNTGSTIYEMMNEDAVHTKTILVDNQISIVGSYNLDMRSTYLDTELMLVIDSEELNQHLREMDAEYMEKSMEVHPNGTEIPGKKYQKVELSKKKQNTYQFLKVIIQPFRYLL